MKIETKSIRSHINKLKKSRTKLCRQDAEKMSNILINIDLKNYGAAENIYSNMDTIVRDDFCKKMTNDYKDKEIMILLADKLGFEWMGSAKKYLESTDNDNILKGNSKAAGDLFSTLKTPRLYNQDLLNAMEWGFKAHEKGKNLELATSEFKELIAIEKDLIKEIKKSELVKCFGRLAYAGVLTISQQSDIMKKIEEKEVIGNKRYCPKCCKEIKLSELLIGIGGCIYCPENENFTKKDVKKVNRDGRVYEVLEENEECYYINKGPIIGDVWVEKATCEVVFN